MQHTNIIELCNKLRAHSIKFTATYTLNVCKSIRVEHSNLKGDQVAVLLSLDFSMNKTHFVRQLPEFSNKI
jgi:hypothetical protein